MPFFNLPSGSSGGGSGGSALPTLSGSGAPGSSIGSVGQLYIDTANKVLYGPKSASGWGTGIPLVTTAWVDVTGKPTTFSPTAHSHVVADVSGLQTALDGKAAATHQHAIADVNNLQATLNAKAEATHTHAIADVSNLQTTLNGKAASTHTHAIADVSGLQAALDAKAGSGTYATLVNGTVPASQLPSYVDDVIDVGGTLPSTGETGKIYVVTSGASVNKVYRWSGSSFIEIVSSPGSTDAIAEGSTNLYFTNSRAIAAVQSQLDGKASSSHTHSISDVTGLQSQLDGKAASSHTHTVSAITGLQALLDAKAASTHTHVIGDIPNLEARLDLASTLTTPPASDTASGTPGQLAIDSTYLYGCIAANTWRRIEWGTYGSAAGGITITSQPQDAASSGSSGSVTITTSTVIDSWTGTIAQANREHFAAYGKIGSMNYATSSALANYMMIRNESSQEWTGRILPVDSNPPPSTTQVAATEHGQILYDPYYGYGTPVPQPYRFVWGKAGTLVLAKEEWETTYYGFQPTPYMLYSSDTTSTNPTFAPATISSGAQWNTIGVTGVAANQNLMLATIAVGFWSHDSYGGYAYGTRMYSNYPVAYSGNGSSWSTVAVDENVAWNGIVWTGSRYVAIGQIDAGQPQGAVWWSSNGLSWTKVSLPANLGLLSIASGNGRLVVVLRPQPLWGDGGPGTAWWRPRSGYINFADNWRDVLVSTDNGSTWTRHSSALPMLEQWVKVVFVGGTINRFVAFATANQVCAVSADGVTWDPVFRSETNSYNGSPANVGDDLFAPFGGYAAGQGSKKLSFSASGGSAGSATFSVTATATGTLAYQWQKSTNGGSTYADISGETSSTLSLSGLTSADNGNKYRCKLTSGSFTTYSNAATLTVSA